LELEKRTTICPKELKEAVLDRKEHGFKAQKTARGR
jgi:hypothetical protein